MEPKEKARPGGRVVNGLDGKVHLWLLYYITVQKATRARTASYKSAVLASRMELGKIDSYISRERVHVPIQYILIEKLG